MGGMRLLTYTLQTESGASLQGAGWKVVGEVKRPGSLKAPHDVTPAPFRDLLLADQPDPAAGPVAVELSYRIDPAMAEAFLTLAIQLKGPRQRDGATFWRIYRDLDDPGRFVERFIVTRWADYLHTRARQTVADEAIEVQLRTLLLPGEQVVIQHYIAER